MALVLITGASGGIGRALAEKLLQDGHQVARVTRDASRLQEVSDAIVADCSTEAGAELALSQTLERFGRAPESIVHAAGNTLIAPVSRTSEVQYRAVMAANLDSAFFLSRAAITAWSGSRFGCLLFFSSVVAGIGVANHAAVAAAKAGVEALTRSLAADYAKDGLRVNCIAPGLMRTPMTERMLAHESASRQIAAQYPLGRHGQAADAVALASFLLGEQASWITGQVIALDGGFSAVRPYVKV
jgi:NAD(P)-dependent dehydrogenase (short-subunit alcohol dehydrogenase family)